MRRMLTTKQSDFVDDLNKYLRIGPGNNSLDIEEEKGVSIGHYDANQDEYYYIFQVLGNNIICPNLPTSDPQVAGALWNDNGVLKISAGE